MADVGSLRTVDAMTMVVSLVLAAHAFFLAAAFASFGCVVAERVPAGESLNGRSRCACGSTLRAVDLVPALSWLAYRGTARCCGARVPLRYFAAEATSGIAAAVVVGLATPTFLELGRVVPTDAIAAAVMTFGVPVAWTLALWGTPAPAPAVETIAKNTEASAR